MGKVVLAGVCLDFLSPEGEEGADYVSLDRQDAVEPCKACAAKQVEEEGFGGVVAVVGCEDGGVGVLLPKLLKVVVAQLPCRLLDALVVL